MVTSYKVSGGLVVGAVLLVPGSYLRVAVLLSAAGMCGMGGKWSGVTLVMSNLSPGAVKVRHCSLGDDDAAINLT